MNVFYQEIDVSICQGSLEDARYWLNFFIYGLLIHSLFSFLTDTLHWHLFTYIGEFFTQNLKKGYFRKLVHNDIEFFDDPKNHPASLANRLIKETTKVNGIVGITTGTTIRVVSTFVKIFVFGFIYSWQLSLVGLIICSFASVLLFLFSFTKAHNNSQEASLDDGSLMISEVLTNMKVVRSLNAQKSMLQIFSELDSKFQNKKIQEKYNAQFLLQFFKIFWIVFFFNFV